MKKNNLVGETFNRLTVVSIYGRDKKQSLLWCCTCSCGGKTIARAYDLKGGKVKSCGCIAKEGNTYKHGMARKGKKRSKEYSIWASMIARCKNKTDRSWKYYGGRGITVCPRWLEFTNFYNDMGGKPENKTLDRIDNSKGYGPENCAWRTKAEQNRNTRQSVLVILDGKSMALVEALQKTGCCRGKLHYRMKKFNITHQEALNLWLQQKKVL